jgi:uncharacterized protein (TIGR03437 family)
VDGTGAAYIAGATSGADFPVTGGAYQPGIGAGCTYPAFEINTGLIGVIRDYLVDDNFVVKLSADGQKALYSTLLGGSCFDRPSSIAVDGSGNVYIAGETDSADYPLVAGVFGAPQIPQFASFFSALNPSGAALGFSTYLNAGSAPVVAAGPGGIVYAAGATGPGAQSQPVGGAYTSFPLIATDGYLGAVRMPSAVPAVNLTQVANAFSLLPGPVAPGEIVSLSVPGFVPAQPMDAGLNVLLPLTTNLGGVQVFFDGRPVTVMSIFPGKIVCIAPAGIAGRKSSGVQVSNGGALSNILTVSVAATALGLLSADGSGTGAAYAQNFDGSLNSASNPAARGSKVTAFFTGAGVTNPPEADGVPVPGGDIVPAAVISPNLGSIVALPGFVPGIFAHRVLVPADTPSIPRWGFSLQSNASASQNLFVYVK